MEQFQKVVSPPPATDTGADPAKDTDLPVKSTAITEQVSSSIGETDDNNNNSNNDTNLCHVCHHSLAKNCWKKSFVHRWLHAEKTELYNCQYCDQKFDEFPLLQTHERDHYDAALEQLAQNQNISDYYQPVIEPTTSNLATFYGMEYSLPWMTLDCKIPEKRLKSRRFATIMENYHPIRRRSITPSYDAAINHHHHDHVSVIKPPPYYGTYHAIVQSSNIFNPWIPF